MPSYRHHGDSRRGANKKTTRRSLTEHDEMAIGRPVDTGRKSGEGSAASTCPDPLVLIRTRGDSTTGRHRGGLRVTVARGGCWQERLWCRFPVTATIIAGRKHRIVDRPALCQKLFHLRFVENTPRSLVLKNLMHDRLPGHQHVRPTARMGLCAELRRSHQYTTGEKSSPRRTTAKTPRSPLGLEQARARFLLHTSDEASC